MHSKIHSVIFLLFRIKNVDTETGWNVQIPMSIWIVSAEKGYLLSEQKKFFKINQKILMKSTNQLFSLYNDFVVQGRFPL